MTEPTPEMFTRDEPDRRLRKAGQVRALLLMFLIWPPVVFVLRMCTMQ